MKTMAFALTALIAAVAQPSAAAAQAQLAPWVPGLAPLLRADFAAGKALERAGQRIHYMPPRVQGISVLGLTKLKTSRQAVSVIVSTKSLGDFEGARWGAVQPPCGIAAYGQERWYRIDIGPLQGAVLQLQKFDDSVQGILRTGAYVLDDRAMESKVRERAMKCLAQG